MIKYLIDKIKSSPEKWIFWSIAATALLLRFEYLREYSNCIHFPFAIGPDVQEYDERARELLNGVIFPAESDIHAPLYSFFLALLYKITNFSIGSVRVVQLLLNWAAYISLAELIRRLSKSFKLASFFLFFSLFTPVLFFHQAELISESLLIPLIAAFFWLLYFAKQNSNNYFFAGIILGFTVLTHGLMTFFLAAEVGYFAIKKQWKTFLLLSAGALIIISTTITAKSIYYKKFTPIQENSFFNLWIGNNPDADGGCYLRPEEWGKKLNKFRTESIKRNIPENLLITENIASFYRNSPEKLLILPLKKALLLLSPSEPIAGADPEYLIRMTKIQRFGAGMMGAVILLAAIGIFFAIHKKESSYIHFYLLTGALCAGMLLTVVSGRYRQGMMPGIILLAAFGALNLGKKVWLIIFPVIISGALIIPALAGNIQRNEEAASIIGEAHYRKKEFDQAEKFLKIAYRNNIQPERFANMLGSIAEESGNYSLAEKYYNQAIIRTPEHHDGFLNMGHLYFYQFPRKRNIALNLLKEALARKTALPSAYDMLGQDLAQKKDFAGALKMFELALYYAPDNTLYKKKVELCRTLAEERKKNAPESGNR